MRRIAVFVIAAICATAVIWWMLSGTPTTTEELRVQLDTTWPRAISLILLLAVLGAGMIAGGPRLIEVGRALLVWGALAVVLIAVYSYRTDIERTGRTVLSSVVPGLAIPIQEGVTISRSADGHFRIKGAINGTPVTFLLDTGASLILLTAEDASRAGIAAAGTDFSLPVSTANGITHVAPVSLDLVTVGSVEETHVAAAVAPAGSVPTSLLGMSFLSRLYRFEITGDRLVMQQ